MGFKPIHYLSLKLICKNGRKIMQHYESKPPEVLCVITVSFPSVQLVDFSPYWHLNVGLWNKPQCIIPSRHHSFDGHVSQLVSLRPAVVPAPGLSEAALSHWTNSWSLEHYGKLIQKPHIRRSHCTTSFFRLRISGGTPVIDQFWRHQILFSK